MQGKYTSLWAHFPQTCQSKSKSKSPSEYRPHNSLTQRRMHAKQEEITSATHSQVTDFIKMIKKPAWRTAWLTGRLTEPTVCSWPQEWKPKNIQQPTASGNNRKHLSTLCYAPLEPRCVSHSSAKSTHKPNVTQGAGKKVKKKRKKKHRKHQKKNTNARRRFKCLSQRHIDKPPSPWAGSSFWSPDADRSRMMQIHLRGRWHLYWSNLTTSAYVRLSTAVVSLMSGLKEGFQTTHAAVYWEITKYKMRCQPLWFWLWFWFFQFQSPNRCA